MFSRLKTPVLAGLACAMAVPFISVPAAAQATAYDVTIRAASEKQVIRGFGGMNHPLWIGDLTPEQRETAFGNGENQLGFSVLRIPITEDKTNWYREVETAKAAQEHGAIVFASPWNPPSDMVETFTQGTSTGTGTTYEAETGTALAESIVGNAYSGYTGSGYVDFQAATDASVQFNGITIGSTGTKNIKIRYALQTGTAYLDVYVNGTKALSQVAFAATGSWTSWGELSIQVPMVNGTSTLKLVTTGTEGPNIDHVQVSPYVQGTAARRLKYDRYEDYAQYLNDFDSYMKSNGVNLYGISIQNEPDYAHDWTWWSPDEMLRFMKENAGSIHNRVIAPESFSYVKKMSDPLLNDPAALANMDILGAHTYGTKYSDFPYPLFEQKGAGKELWMTEVYYPNSESNSADRWPEALGVAEHMYNAMVEGNFQTYVWWYIRRQYGPIKEDGTISKRGYAMAHYSKFVRPGYVRVDATRNPAPGVFVSAYKGDGKIVMVAVNKGTSAVSQTFGLENGSMARVASWITDGSRSLAAGTPVRLSDASFSAELPAQSVTTFVAELGTQSDPAAGLTADNSVEPGSTFTATVSLDNVAQSAYAQDLILTYDAHVFDYVSAAGASDSIRIVKEERGTAGQVRLVAAHIGGVSGASTPVLKVIFKVKEGVQNTSGTIAAVRVKLGTAPAGAVVQAAPGSKSISIGAPSADLNKDGAVDVGDLAIAASHFGKNSGSADWATARTADQNGDGRIDIADLAYVAGRMPE
ncbi:carbohydrate-binding protein [Gorillibacterium sp. sgz5001074]|uniref:carbohydrate-binding protein n=1 Tax=Gorillibacterium sp. sgz5001074 TaxID=3446695 RepID=UPI003F66A261